MQDAVHIRAGQAKAISPIASKLSVIPAERIAIIAIVLATLAYPLCAVAEDWRRLQERQASTVDVDLQSVAPLGNLKQVVTREIFTSLRKNPRSKEYDETQTLLQIDCAGAKAALKEVTYYLQGQALDTVTIQPQNLSFHRRFWSDSSQIFWSLVCTPQAQTTESASH